MKVKYKGFDIEVKREKCLAGYPLLYYSIYKNNYELTSGFEDSEEKVRNYIDYLKEYIDNLIDCLNKKICPYCDNDLDNGYHCTECCEEFDKMCHAHS